VLEANAVPVIVTNDFPPEAGGIQRVMSQIARVLADLGEIVVVVAPYRDGCEAVDNRLPFKVIRYKETGHRNLAIIAMIPAFLRAVRLAKDRTTIASIWWPSGFVAAITPVHLRGRLAILAHGSEIMPHRRGLRRQIMLFVYNRASIILANSNFTTELLRECGVKNNVAPLPLATDSISILPSRALVPTVLSVGRLVRRKGFDLTLEAIAKLKPDFPTIQYVIVGSGPQEQELRAMVKALDIESNVIFRGKLDDAQLQEAYSNAWVFALPTRRIVDDVEGFGLVFLEAAMAGLPSVGGIDSGAADAIVDGETGFLVDGTSPEAIAQSLRALISDRSLAQTLGTNGKIRASRLTWDQTATAILRYLGLSHRAS